MRKITNILFAGLMGLLLLAGACKQASVAENNSEELEKESVSKDSGNDAEVASAQKEEQLTKNSSKIIASNSVGKVKLGMSVAKAREALKPLTLKRESDGEGIALIAVEKGNQIVMMIYAGEEDPDAPIDNKAVIEQIEVLGADYKTAKGVHPNMKVKNAENIYGKVKEIALSEIEAREYADFTKQPKGLKFRLTSTDGTAGTYPKGSRKTDKYTPNAKIASVLVWGVDEPEEKSSSKFSSVYTSLSKGCKSSGGENGGHVSTVCEGPGGYQLNYFDSATTLQFVVENTNGKNSTTLASQALGYDTKKGKVEFRVADGKPFAVIMRIYSYQKGDDGLIKYPVKVTGEFLIVKGLKGFEHIDSKINVRKTKNANAVVRKIADGWYGKKK